MGVEIDPVKNATPGPRRMYVAVLPGARAVIPTNEELAIANETARLCQD
jgi:acetate kinase